MDPSLLLVAPVFNDVPTSPNDLPVATLTRLAVGGVPQSAFPHYRGRNLIGTNPFVAGVFIPWGFGASEIHVIMEINEYGLVAVNDPTPRQVCALYPWMFSCESKEFSPSSSAGTTPRSLVQPGPPFRMHGEMGLGVMPQVSLSEYKQGLPQ
ncbi:MAG: hypothetical protein J3Q66DRAFT_372960 [Benniella sp.]|nr:MAG: hypothetical protein J3Q66DRAFT_372960 [Benniella sp.]